LYGGLGISLKCSVKLSLVPILIEETRFGVSCTVPFISTAV